MAIPRCLREQAKFYESKGFHMIEAQPRAGAHWMARFAEFPDPVIVSINAMIDRRAVHNNVAHYRRLKDKVVQQLKEKANGTDPRGQSQGQDKKDS